MFFVFIVKDLQSLGGGTILNLYNNSLLKLLSAVYRDFNWLPWKFSTRDFWGEQSNQIRFLNWAAKQLKIKQMSDWYSISTNVK